MYNPYVDATVVLAQYIMSPSVCRQCSTNTQDSISMS